MPGRQSHGGAPSKKARVRGSNSKKRSLDAFAIASAQNPENIKIRSHRLGASEGEIRPAKRPRDDEDHDEDEAEEELNSKKKRKGPEKGKFDELDLDEGSDSEGNQWKLGQVDDDDDSDLDSDEAFGESDEERFEDFAFSGSSDRRGSKKKKTSFRRDTNLDEENDGESSDSELSEGDLGEGAIDLAAMLDATGEEDEARGKNRKEGVETGSDSAEEDAESEESESESSVSSADDDDSTDPVKLAALQSLISNLSQEDQSRRAPAKQRNDGASEYDTPSDFGLTSKTKLTLDDLGLPTVNDPHIRKSLKFLVSESNGEVKRRGVPARLEVPLAKRQQDRLDRAAAYEKSKETLARWTDTVKHNRRADHLIFPLPDNDLTSAQANSRLQSTGSSKPFNELEATIQSILEESGLATGNGKDDEDHIREFEDLEIKKMTLEEVKSRRNQLRMARDLLFREEAKAKRIKKIKSKSYRKVHRKQREKEERLNKEALAEGGFEPSEDEFEAQDRRRAMERMGAKHRGSKWAKATKQAGRAAWDVDARDGITEMARRDEELRKRVEGRAVRREGEEDSETSFSDSDHEASDDDDGAYQRRALLQLQKAGNADIVDDSAPGSKLANMKFMRNAEKSRKKENDAMVEKLRLELAGEEIPSEEEVETDIGRRVFGPGSQKSQGLSSKATLQENEFEEPLEVDEEDNGDGIEFLGMDNGPSEAANSPQSKKTKGSARAGQPRSAKTQPDASSEGGAWSKVTSKSDSISHAEAKRRRHKRNDAIDVEELDLSKAAEIATRPKPRKSATKPSTLEVPSDSESNDDNSIHLPFAIRDQELIKRAFAGADVVGEFEAMKKQTIEDEDEKIIDNTLPGWGSWAGDGLSKREQARNRGKVLTKSEGIKAQNRKDAKLERVIINQKRVKKNVKYLASNLPHPFETMQQYERSLRLPVGAEWTTKETFQSATKPRVLLKQGIIAPMSKPLL